MKYNQKMRREDHLYYCTKAIIFLFILIIVVLMVLLYKCGDEDKADEEYTQIYREQATRRRKLFLETNNFNDLSFLVEEVNCPKLARLGAIHDGGKWICNPMAVRNLEEQCVVYSFGLNDNVEFEQEFMQVTHRVCKMRAIDVNNPPDILALRNISEVLITRVAAATSENAISFTDIMKKFGDDRMEILKMDIEGTEEELIDQILAVPICQILMEIHIQDPGKTVAFLQKISAKGFYLYATEENPFRRDVKEYSFIHESCMERYGANLLAKYFS